MVKKILFSVFAISLIFLVFIFVTINSFKSVSEDSTLKNFLILKGSSASKIGSDLKDYGFIKSSLAFKFYVQLTGKQNRISAGEFRLSSSMSLIEIVETLNKGPVEVWVTIPEGLRHEEIAQKFANALQKDEQFIKEFITLASLKEGYLFPETYLFPKSITPEKIIEKMLSIYTLKTNDKPTNDRVIMASIIERETRGNDEKPIVAGILYKRLENSWPLQVDASIQYAKGNWEPILVADKEIDSFYNTYKFTGLPPSPISNPGLSSINAAINPKESEYWYYIHDDFGIIHYARDLSEHNSNIQRYLY